MNRARANGYTDAMQGMPFCPPVPALASGNADTREYREGYAQGEKDRASLTAALPAAVTPPKAIPAPVSEALAYRRDFIKLDGKVATAFSQGKACEQRMYTLRDVDRLQGSFADWLGFILARVNS